jgi:hypothetical protein
VNPSQRVGCVLIREARSRQDGSSPLLEGTFGEIGRPPAATGEDIEVIDDEVRTVEMPGQDSVLKPKLAIRRECHGRAPRDQSRIGLSRHLSPVTRRWRTCRKRMHIERTAAIGEDDLDDIGVSALPFTHVPTSDVKINAADVKPVFSAGLLNLNAMAVSSMISRFAPSAGPDQRLRRK